MHARLFYFFDVEFLCRVRHKADLLVKFFFGLLDLLEKKSFVDAVTYEHKIDDLGAFSLRQVPHEVNPVKIPYSLQHIFYHIFQPGHLHDDTVDVGKEWMFGVHREHLFVALGARFQETGFLEPVQLDPYGIRAFAELLLKIPQVSGILWKI
jgi:hypothetical protein